DGGQNWNEISPSGYSDRFNDMVFFDEQHGYLSVQSDLLETVDGGDTWTLVYAGFFGNLLFFPDPPSEAYSYDQAGQALSRHDLTNLTTQLVEASAPSAQPYVEPRDIVAVGGVYYAVGCNRFYRIGAGDTAVTHQYLHGKIYDDQSANCSLEVGEEGLADWPVRASRDGNQSWTLTDSLGHYSFQLDTGSYRIELFPPSPNWQSCTPSTEVLLDQILDTFFLDFPQQMQVQCPQLAIDLSNAALLRCQDNRVRLSYKNSGTGTATAAYVDLRLAPVFSISNSSISSTLVGPNTHRFPLGDLAPQQIGNFWVDTYLDCTDNIAGQTFQMEAHIFPDSFCLPPPSQWDGSRLRVSANCVNDSLFFRLRNDSDSPMGTVANILITEDDVLLFDGGWQGDANSDTFLLFPPQGATLRLAAEQVPFYPGRSFPSVAVEACGTDSNGDISLGYVNQYPSDDQDPFVDILSQVSRESYPNRHLEAYPEGYGPQHFILPSTDLEYLVRLSNTSSDTVYQVVLFDTLSPFLQPASIQMGGSSHPYNWTLSGEGILRIAFEDVVLPPATVDPLAARLFVQYRIDQLPDNLPGTVIQNRVGYRMDFSPYPVNTIIEHIVEGDFLPALQMMSIEGQIQNQLGLPLIDLPLRLEPLGRSLRSDQDGYFAFEALPYHPDYNLYIDRQAIEAVQISAHDLFWMARYLDQPELDRPRRWSLLADVDRNGRVNSQDLGQLEQLLLRTDNQAGEIKNWYFLPGRAPQETDGPSDSIVLRNLISNNQIDLIGLLAGDVDGEQNLPNAFERVLPFSLQLLAGTTENESVVYLYPRERVALRSGQLSISYDADQYELREVSSPLAETDPNIHWAYHDDGRGLLNLCWYRRGADQVLDPAVALATWELRHKADRSTTLVPRIKIAAEPLVPEAYVWSEAAGRAQRWRIVSQDDAVAGDRPIRWSVRPNLLSANETTHIYLSLASSSTVSLALHEASGQPLLQLHDQELLPAGDYLLPLRLDELSSGIYYLRARVGTATDTIELVVY
ncbi:MAG: hypothetical protein AAFR05_20185, partial [Bacteroidota bacterium]